MASIKCGNCAQTHGSVADVKECYRVGGPRQMAVVVTATGASASDRFNADWTAMKNESARLEAEAEHAAYDREAAAEAVRKAQEPKPEPASDRQMTFLKALTEERGLGHQHREWSKAEASAEISRLLKMPKAAVRTQPQGRTSEPEDGIYIDTDKTIYKVYQMVHGSGRQGVKRLQINEAEKKGTFVYLGTAVKHLPTTARRMSLEEAKEFGAIYGFCVRCGATLTDDNSIARGMGEICAGKGW